MKKRLRKHVGKKSPTLIQNESTWGPTWVPRGDFILGGLLPTYLHKMLLAFFILLILPTLNLIFLLALR